MSKIPGLKVRAGFAGKSLLARSVNRAMCNELEIRERERAGGQRMMGSKVTIVRSGDDKLVVQYKTGRKVVKEEYQYGEWKEAEKALLDVLEGEVLATVLEVASHYPEIYWLARHHLGVDTEEVLKRAGIIAGGKKRRL